MKKRSSTSPLQRKARGGSSSPGPRAGSPLEAGRIPTLIQRAAKVLRPVPPSAAMRPNIWRQNELPNRKGNPKADPFWRTCFERRTERTMKSLVTWSYKIHDSWEKSGLSWVRRSVGFQKNTIYSRKHCEGFFRKIL